MYMHEKIKALVAKFYKGTSGKLPKGEFSGVVRSAINVVHRTGEYPALDDPLVREAVLSATCSYFGTKGAKAAARNRELARLLKELEAEEEPVVVATPKYWEQGWLFNPSEILVEGKFDLGIYGVVEV
jgi:hypothetical protein